MTPRSAQSQTARDRRDSTILRIAATSLRRRVDLVEHERPISSTEALLLADVLDAAARDIESLGLCLRSCLIAAASEIPTNPAEDPIPTPEEMRARRTARQAGLAPHNS
jgi:hypothetical protein